MSRYVVVAGIGRRFVDGIHRRRLVSSGHEGVYGFAKVSAKLVLVRKSKSKLAPFLERWLVSKSEPYVVINGHADGALHGGGGRALVGHVDYSGLEALSRRSI